MANDQVTLVATEAIPGYAEGDVFTVSKAVAEKLKAVHPDKVRNYTKSKDEANTPEPGSTTEVGSVDGDVADRAVANEVNRTVVTVSGERRPVEDQRLVDGDTAEGDKQTDVRVGLDKLQAVENGDNPADVGGDTETQEDALGYESANRKDDADTAPAADAEAPAESDSSAKNKKGSK
jgi:hypothetical protein